jgi:hypothetical protein
MLPPGSGIQTKPIADALDSVSVYRITHANARKIQEKSKENRILTV